MCVAAAIAGGAIVGGGISAIGANSAAHTQANAAQNATNAQLSMFNQVQGNEAPYRQAGQGAVGELGNLLGTSGNTGAAGYGSLNQPFNMADFKSLTPQYQFNLQQGTQGTLNQDAGAQGAESGAALKDLISYNQGYANNSFNSAFQNYQTQQNNVFNRLSTLAGMGQAAASNQATGASSFAGNVGQSMTNVGTALGAGQVGVANSLSGGLNSALPWLYANQNPALSPYGTGSNDPGGG